MRRVFIKTYGCSLNISDSELMAGLLSDSGRYLLADTISDAHIVIINSCTVKNMAENKFWKDVRKIKKPKILAGCVPEAEKDKSLFKDFSVIGPRQLTRVLEIVDRTLNGEIVRPKGSDVERLNLPKTRKNPVVEIVPVSRGCLGACFYCKVKFARGNLVSYPIGKIESQVRKAIRDGVKEIWLTSRDMGCYGKDIDTDLVELIKRISSIDGDFFIRVGMANPNFVIGMLDDLIEVFKHPKVFKFLHIPVQSGNDRVLKAMNRRYTVSDFKTIVRRFREEIPDMTFATDIICGYPTESEEEFRDSIRLVKETMPDALNRSRFWPRPGTKAAEMEQVGGDVTKTRSGELTDKFYNIAVERNRRWDGWKGLALVDENGKDGSMIARNHAYKQIILQGEFEIGDIIPVEIEKTTRYDLRGRIDRNI